MLIPEGGLVTVNPWNDFDDGSDSCFPIESGVDERFCATVL